MPLLEHSRGVIRKRSAIAMVNLANVAVDEVLNALLETLLSNLKKQSAEENSIKIQTLISTFASLSRSNVKGVDRFMEDICRSTINFCKLAQEDDDLKEVCLSALQVFALNSYDSSFSSFIDEAVEVAIQNTQYDPHLNDEMQLDFEDEDVENSDDYSDSKHSFLNF